MYQHRMGWLALALLSGCLWPGSVGAQPNDDFRMRTGYYDLLDEYGSIEDGTGISISIVEGDLNTADDTIFQYMPNTTITALADKVIIDGSGLHNTGPSGHSTVTHRIFMSDMGVARGLDSVTVYEAGDYVGRILGFSSGADPLNQPFSIQNHSWAGNMDTEAEAINALRRLDYLIERDGISMPVGVLNGNQSHSQLLAQSWNTIAVGRVDGLHASNPTTINGVGRVKPDVVSSGATTSTATAEVSSVLAVLHHKANNMGSTDARRPETMKAIVMAGARKQPFADWDRTTTRPLDEVFGAGEVSLYNSYKILEGGETDGSLGVPVDATIGLAGFDYGENLLADSSLFYNFEIGTNQEVNDLSILLTWNLEISDGDLDPGIFDPVAEDLADMSLRLYDSTGSPLDILLDSSLSPVDNVEHIYLSNLGSGLYTIEVSTDMQTDFGLAWYGQVVPEPGSLTLLVGVSVALAAGNRRRRKA